MKIWRYRDWDESSNCYVDSVMFNHLKWKYSTWIVLRIFHIQKSTEKRWVYKIEGYTCSEPIFVKNPQLGLDDDEGVVLTLMTPIYDDLR